MAPDADLAPFFGQFILLTVLFCANLWTPLVEATLIAVDDVGQNHAANREDQYTDENLVGLERRTRDRDHKADAGGRGIQLADHDTDERAAKIGRASCRERG